LADAGVKLSHAALQKYEKGLMGPDSTTLMALSRIFNLEPGYFFRADGVSLGTIRFRKLARFPAREVYRVREEAADFFEKYLQIEQILEIHPPRLPRFELGACGEDAMAALGEQAEQAATSVRKKWKLGEAPLNNVHELLEENGLKVKEVEADSGFNGFSGWADDHTPVIVLAAWLNQDLPRKRMTALHELGHLVMALPGHLTHKQQEALCYRFAGAMLLPATALRARLGINRPDGISFPERLGIKADWGISIAALMRRAADLGVITHHQLKRFHITNRNHRKTEAGAWAGCEAADRYEQLVYRAAAMEVITRAKASELLGVTLREFDHRFAEAAA
jgi:Zn-dependent peptidase ImmA (M78 family)/transcriptional regulator with XRE-family HTH domain